MTCFISQTFHFPTTEKGDKQCLFMPHTSALERKIPRDFPLQHPSPWGNSPKPHWTSGNFILCGCILWTLLTRNETPAPGWRDAYFSNLFHPPFPSAPLIHCLWLKRNTHIFPSHEDAGAHGAVFFFPFFQHDFRRTPSALFCCRELLDSHLIRGLLIMPWLGWDFFLM